MLTNIVGNTMGHIEERPGKVYDIFGKFDCKWRPLKKMLEGIINISLGIRHLCFILKSSDRLVNPLFNSVYILETKVLKEE